MKNIKILFILFSFVTTILKSQTIVEKSTLLKEISEFHDDGIPKTINYLNENLELVIQEKYDIFSDLISSYQFNPKTQKKEGPFVYYPYSNIYNEGFRNSKNDFDFKNVVNKGIYLNGILTECNGCEFFIESEEPNYTEYKKIRKGDILNGRFIGEVSIFYISEGSSIGSIQSISDQLTSYYGRKVNYTMSFSNGNFSKDLLYTISFDSLGYVKDGVYNFKRNKYYYKNKILSGIITYNENNNIPKDSIFSESKVWKINNILSKNTGWITSDEEVLNPLNYNLSNKYGVIQTGYNNNNNNKKLKNLYSLSDKFYFKDIKDPSNLIFFGSEKSELKNMKNSNNNNYNDPYARDKEFNGFIVPEWSVPTPYFFNLGISLLRANKLDSNGIFCFYDHQIIYKYANLYLSGILGVNKNIDEITTSPIINREIINYKEFNFQFEPRSSRDLGFSKITYYYGSEGVGKTGLINKWSVFDFADKFLKNKTIDSLKKDVRINFSNLNIDNYQNEEYVKYNSYSVSDWFEKINEKSQKEGGLILDEENLMNDISNYTNKIEELLISLILLTNSSGSKWEYQKYSPKVFKYQSYLSKKIRKTKDPELLKSLFNFQLGFENADVNYLKIKNLNSLNYIGPDGNFSDSFKMIFEELIKGIENDVHKLKNFLNVRKIYLDIFSEKELEIDTGVYKMNDSDYYNWYDFEDEDSRKYFQEIKKFSINYKFKNPKKVVYLRRFIKKFGQDKVNYWNEIFSKKTIENRLSWENYANPSPHGRKSFNEYIDIGIIINENYIHQDFSELLSHLNEVKEYLSHFK